MASIESELQGMFKFAEEHDNLFPGEMGYDTWEQGFEDWFRLITELYIAGWNLRTVDEIIPVYAPSGDSNDPPSYIASVKAMVDSWRGK